MSLPFMSVLFFTSINIAQQLDRLEFQRKFFRNEREAITYQSLRESETLQLIKEFEQAGFMRQGLNNLLALLPGRQLPSPADLPRITDVTDEDEDSP